MAKKRANGEGSIRKRKDGRWEARYTAGHDSETGKAIVKNVLGRTQAEAKEKLKEAGLEHIRFRDLRHTFATLALQNGVDVKTVSAMLGHSSAGFTLATYTHTTTAAQHQAAAIMGSLVGAGVQ